MQVRIGTGASIVWLAFAVSGIAQEPFEIPIWPGTAPGSENSSLREEYSHREITDGTDTPRDRSVKGVTKPTLTVYLPQKDKANGVAVVVCPGGAFTHLAIDKEGHDVARWLREQGFAGVVLKYRLPAGDAHLTVRETSIADTQRAVRVVRRNALKWNVNQNRIGVMGFSAGGYLAAVAATMFDTGGREADDPIKRQSCRPDFVTPVYPLISLEIQGKRSPKFLERMLGPSPGDDSVRQFSPNTCVRSDSPPAFLVHAHDDGLTCEHSIQLFLALRAANVPAELHVYAKGGHGFGIRQRGQPVSAWRERWLEWMQSQGFLSPSTH